MVIYSIALRADALVRKTLARLGGRVAPDSRPSGRAFDADRPILLVVPWSRHLWRFRYNALCQRDVGTWIGSDEVVDSGMPQRRRVPAPAFTFPEKDYIVLSMGSSLADAQRPVHQAGLNPAEATTWPMDRYGIGDDAALQNP